MIPTDFAILCKKYDLASQFVIYDYTDNLERFYFSNFFILYDLISRYFFNSRSMIHHEV